MHRTEKIIEKTSCYHCGEDCDDTPVHAHGKPFCCAGCKMVYELINEKGLCEYYDRERSPGTPQRIPVREGKFAFLDNKEIAAKLVHFKEGTLAHITFYLPQMHCSSCIWLLEHLGSLHKGVLKSTVNFLKKDVTVIFDTDRISLKVLAELLTSIGYEPHISMKDLDSGKIKKYDRKRIYKIGIAGFCFGNIMLLSFPEYFSDGGIEGTQLKNLFSYANLILSLPVFFFCASEFFI
jgi:Cu+-exporting ATPase